MVSRQPRSTEPPRLGPQASQRLESELFVKQEAAWRFAPVPPNLDGFTTVHGKVGHELDRLAPRRSVTRARGEGHGAQYSCPRTWMVSRWFTNYSVLDWIGSGGGSHSHLLASSAVRTPSPP